MGTTPPEVLCPELADPNRRNIITLENLDGLALSNYSRVPGTQTNISCRQPDQYTLHGDDSLICLDSGQWDKPIPTCVQSYPVIARTDREDNQTPNTFGDFLLSNINRTIGSEVDIECLQPTRYALVGTDHLICQENHQWDKPIPFCSRKFDCPVIVRHDLIANPNADLFGDFRLSTNSRSPGTEVDVECLRPERYKLIGNSHLICQTSGRWNSYVPYCYRNGTEIINTTTSPVTSPSKDLLSQDETIILAVVGSVLCVLLVAVIVTLTYILCRARRQKARKSNPHSTLYENNGYSAEEEEGLVELFALPRPMVSRVSENMSGSLYSLPLNQLSVHQPGSRHRSYSLGSTTIPVLHSSAEGGLSTRGRKESIATSTFDSGEHSLYSHVNGDRSLVIMPKPAYSSDYGPFWYYPDVPDDPETSAAVMQTVVDFLHETGSIKRPNLRYPLRHAPASDAGYASYSETRDVNNMYLAEVDVHTYI